MEAFHGTIRFKLVVGFRKPVETSWRKHQVSSVLFLSITPRYEFFGCFFFLPLNVPPPLLIVMMPSGRRVLRNRGLVAKACAFYLVPAHTCYVALYHQYCCCVHHTSVVQQSYILVCLLFTIVIHVVDAWSVSYYTYPYEYKVHIQYAPLLVGACNHMRHYYYTTSTTTVHACRLEPAHRP